MATPWFVLRARTERLAHSRGTQGRRVVNDAERLAAYEGFSADVRTELARTAERMEGLRAQGKVKTATYRQLFAARATLKDIDRRLSERGL